MKQRVLLKIALGCVAALTMSACNIHTSNSRSDVAVLSAGSTLYPDAELTTADYSKFLWTFTPSVAQTIADDEVKMREAMIELHSSWALSKAARDSGIDRKPEVAAALDEAERRILSNAYLKEQIKNGSIPTDDEFLALAKEAYLAHPERYTTIEARTVRHILLSDSSDRCGDESLESRVKTLEILLSAGGDFSQLAKQYSDDEGTASNGGLLPSPIRRDGKTVPKFEEATFELTLDSPISKPISTSFGIHFIKLESISEPELLPFETVEKLIVETERRSFLNGRMSEVSGTSYPALDSLNINEFEKLLRLRVEAADD